MFPSSFFYSGKLLDAESVKQDHPIPVRGPSEFEFYTCL